MKFAPVLVVLLLATGCSSNKPALTSTNDDLLIIGSAPPAGYPKSHIQNNNGYCVNVTDKWQKYDHEGEMIWLKTTNRALINCS